MRNPDFALGILVGWLCPGAGDGEISPFQKGDGGGRKEKVHIERATKECVEARCFSVGHSVGVLQIGDGNWGLAFLNSIMDSAKASYYIFGRIWGQNMKIR